MKINNIIILPLVCTFILFASIVRAEPPAPTAPQPSMFRVDEDNSWGTLGRLYVILATTDNDETCGKTAENNGKAIGNLFRTHVAQKAVTVLKIPPQNISRQTVLSLMGNLPLREDDAVVFYYSGKGDFDRKYGQYFELPDSKEELYRSEVQAAILKRQPRLCVILSDFCDPAVALSEENTGSEDKPNEGNETKDNEKGVKATENVLETAPLFFSLFFSGRGVVDIHSTSFGQASCMSKKGIGCFTEMFTGLLAANGNKVLSWRRVFPYVQEGTSLVFAKSFPNGAATGEGMQQRIQTPILLQIGNDVIDSPTRLRIYPPDADDETNATVNTDEQRRDEDRQMVMQLVQQAVGDLRPFDAADRGTHENHLSLDTDNTVLGLDGKPFSREMAMVPRPVPTQGSTSILEDAPPAPPRLGIQAEDNQGDGVRITRVMPNLPGARAGLTAGDVIIEIDGKKIATEKEYSDAVDAASGRMVIIVKNVSGRVVTVMVNMRN